jgi:hypothetical protein
LFFFVYKQVIDNINRTPSAALGFHTPAEFKYPVTDPQCREVRQIYAAAKEAKRSSSSAGKKDDGFRVGQWVYADTIQKNKFMRGFDVSRQKIYAIKSIDQRPGQPRLFTLREWKFNGGEDGKGGLGETVGQQFYAENLRHADDPSNHSFAIDRVGDERKLPGKEREYLVRFAGQQKDTWIPERDLTGDSEAQKKKKATAAAASARRRRAAWSRFKQTSTTTQAQPVVKKPRPPPRVRV